MTGGDDPYPADQLIHDLIAHPRPATEEEIRQIADRIASAPFSTESQRVPVLERGFTYRGVQFGTLEDSLTLHFVHHVIMEAQWAEGTTVEAYVRSLHRAAHAPQARIALYRQWGERDIAAIIVPTQDVLDPREAGRGSLPNLLVVYRADRGMLVSGYQFSTIDMVRIPRTALWLT